MGASCRTKMPEPAIAGRARSRAPDIAAWGTRLAPFEGKAKGIDMTTETHSTATHAWAGPMIIGILLMIGGTFALAATALTSIASILYFGVLLLSVGLLEIIAAFRVRSTGPVLTYILAGLLTLVVGGLFVFRPAAGLASMTLLIAGYFFASGLFRGITSVMERYSGWGWDFAYALLAVALGAYVCATWPLSSFLVLGTIVAIEIIARGVTLVAASWALRDFEHRHPLEA
jgi:uncharacterized membrane protein HdeD (DUF308 family)